MVYLSICIPTYNRSSYLRDTLDSFVSQPEFIGTDEIEILISDNCSTDDTETVAAQYTSKYPSKIKYSRNTQNILDGNFQKVLSLASGNILKLNNDTLFLNKGALGSLVKHIKYCSENNFNPFLLNGAMPEYKEPILCEDVASFISVVSFRCTWIGGFCIEKNAFHNLENFSEESALMLVQVDVLMKLLKTGHKVLVIPDLFSTSVTPGKKGGYNLPKVFLTNYFKILGKYLTSYEELIVFQNEKKAMLFKFILPWLVSLRKDSLNQSPNFTFDVSNYKEVIKSEFTYPTYLKFEGYLGAKIVVSYIKSLAKGLLNYKNYTNDKKSVSF